MKPDHATACALFAVDPAGLGGAVLRSASGSARDDWMALLRELLPTAAPIRRVPLNINDTALLGGLDLGATLQSGRPVAQQGVLAQADGGVVVLAMAERLSAGAAARLAAVLDAQEVVIEREGMAVRKPARIGMVALDESLADDESVALTLTDRLAFDLDFSGRPDADDPPVDWQALEVEQGRARLATVTVSDEAVEALCAAALALGVASLRGPILALRVARAAAALAGLDEVEEDHLSLAARLVLGPRATQLPDQQSEESADAEPQPTDETPEPPADTPPPDQSPEPEQPEQPDPPEPTGDQDAPPEPEADDLEAGNTLAENVLDAAEAAIPPGLLAALKLGQAQRARARTAGRSGAAQKSQTRGRPLGARRGEPRSGARLNVIETLRAAAPWQRLRQAEVDSRPQLASASVAMSAPALAPVLPGRRRLQVRREDFHITRYKQVGQTTTVFVVDASGSSAINRLAEAKGAVELLLADCYVRRDRVAVLAFRGAGVELLLPPTRSLARAKRGLAGLPGGGGTPLASAIDAARELADQISRRGETPILVLLTDGRGNVARDGTGGRARGLEDATAAARQLRLTGTTALLLDTSPRPQPSAEALAREMGAAYIALPYGGAQVLSLAVRAATATGSVRI